MNQLLINAWRSKECSAKSRIALYIISSNLDRSNSIAKSMNQLFYSIAGGIVHQIRSEKLQQYQKWLFAVSEILSKIGIGFISNFLLKARVLSSEKFTLTFEGWNRPVCHLFGFTRVSFCQKLLHFTLGQWSESWRRASLRTLAQGKRSENSLRFGILNLIARLC